MESIPEEFGTKLKNERVFVCYLWRPNGSRCSSISIGKQVWLDFTTKPNEPVPRLVFYIYSMLDCHKTLPWSGGRINKKPYRDLATAIKRVRKLEAIALASGRWVKTPEIKQGSRQHTNRPIRCIA